MDSFWMKIYVFIGILVVLPIHSCHGEKRMMEFPPSWQPIAFPQGSQNLISIANLDLTNKAQLSQIAHHNAQILRQIKGMHPPVTQYHNPFPMFPNGNGHKHMMVQTNNVHQHGRYQPQTSDKYATTQNLIGSSSNVAQTVMPHLSKPPNNFMPPKPPAYLSGKPDFGNYKYFTSFPGSPKLPANLMNAASAQNFQSFSTTSRIPLLRDVTLAAPSSVYKAAQLPAPVINKINAQITSSGRPQAQSLASLPNQIPGHVISQYSHFGPALPIIPNSKPRIKGTNFMASPFDMHHFNSPYSGHLISSGPFIGKNNFINSVQFPHGHGAYHLTNTFLPGVKPNSESLLYPPQKTNLIALPTVPPSVLSPFFQQVQQQQKDAVATATPFDQRKPDLIRFPNDSFKVLTDEYTVHLVPPPVRPANGNFIGNLPTAHPTNPPTMPPPTANTDYFDDEHKKAMDILNKYNIPAISPLQDINRFTYNGARPFKALPTASTYPTLPPSYSTHHPMHGYKQQTRKPDTGYKHHHKQTHPAFVGVKYPYDQNGKTTKKPFLPTPDNSPDIAVTHSFFTIEDAITHAPGHGIRQKPMGGISTKVNPLDDYRRPQLYPTVVNQIEDNIRKPLEEQITEVSTAGEQEADTTLQPPPSSSSVLNRQRQRNKVRRKRPRPTSDSINDVNGEEQPQRNPLQSHRNRINDDREVTTRPNIPKNHKEFASTTQERETLMQRQKETTTIETTHREVTTTASHRSPTRSRPSTDIETFSSKPQKPKDQRRPNNRFEDNKIPRYRPQTTTKSPFSRDPDEQESTTITTHVPKYKASRRPVLSPVTASTSDDEVVTDGRYTTNSIDTYPQTRLPPRTRTSSATTPLSPTTQRMTASSTVSGHSEDNAIVMATKIGVTGDGKYTTEREFISYEEESNEGKYPHVGEISTQSTTTTSTSTESVEPAQSESHKEGMVTSDGPVYRPIDHMKSRIRNRQKEKILEAAAKASSTTTRTTISREPDSSSADKSNEVSLGNDDERARLPLHKGTVKVVEITTESGNSTKSKRINANSNKFDSKNRPRFSVKEYRQRLTSTTTAEPVQQSNERESTTASYTRLRFPTRNRFYTDIKNKSQDATKSTVDEKLNLVIEAPERSESEESSSETTDTTRKRFSPKDRFSSKVKSTTEGSTSGTSAEASTIKPTTRRGSTRRGEYGNNRIRFSTSTSTSVHSSVEASTPSTRLTTIARNVTTTTSRRPLNNIGLRQRIQNPIRKDSISDESMNDLAIENASDDNSGSTEDYKHETAIMKIAKDDHSYRHRERTTSSSSTSTETSVMSVSENDLSESPSHQSERVAELTIFGSNNFQSVNKGTSSRRVPGYFTIATEDPILPIEAFFPQVKRH